jgi:NADPH2:quinone reductase
MRAAVIDRFGSAAEFTVRRVPRPLPDDHELLVAVVAAGVNPVDAGNRADGAWASLTPPAIIGSDASGVVVATGAAVSDFAVGDEVFYFSDFLGNRAGSYAEYQAIDATLVAAKPAGLTHLEAAVVPLAAGTAYELIMKRLGLRAGESVVIYGAAGGVGGFAVQLAHHVGARVIAVARGQHDHYLRELGAEATVDYSTVDVNDRIATLVGEVDAVADLVGGGVLAASIATLRQGGRAATICEFGGDLDLAIDNNITIHGILVRPDGRRLAELAVLLCRGVLRPVLRREYPLEDVARAHEEIELGHGRGKIALRIRPEPGVGRPGCEPK